MRIAAIPVRGNSKRLPSNIKRFNGRPIIAWSIGSVIKSEIFDIVLFSTGDDKIAEISTQSCAEVPFKKL